MVFISEFVDSARQVLQDRCGMRGLRYVDPDLSIVSLHALNPIATPMTAVYNSGSKNIKNMSNLTNT